MKFNRQAYVPYSVLLKQHEEAQKLKEVLDKNITGTVKWFSLRYHYGFIARDDGKGDVFVHQMNITKSRMNRVYLRSLAHNEKVEFDVVEGKSGPEAANVTGPDGTDVQGVYVIQLRYPLRPNNFNGSRRRRNTSRKNQADGENDENKSPQSDGEKRESSRRRRNTSRKNQADGENDENKSPQSDGEKRGSSRRRRNTSRKNQADGENDENKSPQSDGEKRESSRRRRNTSRKNQAGGENDEKKSQSDEEKGEKKSPQSDEEKGEKKSPQSDEEKGEKKSPQSDEEKGENKSPQADGQKRRESDV